MIIQSFEFELSSTHVTTKDTFDFDAFLGINDIIQKTFENVYFILNFLCYRYRGEMLSLLVFFIWHVKDT